MSDERNPEADFGLLAASSVHDIKNSLGMLLQTLEEVIRETPDQSPEQRRRFAVLQGEAARINNDLMYFLGLYRLQQKQLPLQVQSVFVADFLQEQIAANALLFEIRDLSVTLDCDDGLTAHFDPNLIAGVLNNVLVNGARYARSAIAIRADRENSTLVIEVCDDGAGFPDKMLQQVDASSRGIDFSTGSTSLGLQFAAAVAALHRRGETGGRIALDNPAAGGGRFRLFLP